MDTIFFYNNDNLYKGGTVGLVGESGLGKTTIGDTILNLDPSTAGEIYLEDNKIDYKHFKKEFIKNIQIVFQDPDASLNAR